MYGSFESPIIDEVNRILSDTFALYFKTHAYHWNVRGMFFNSLHQLFQEQYEEMWESVDELAEQLRKLGYLTPPSIALMAPTAIADGCAKASAKEMILDLRNGHITLIEGLKRGIQICQSTGDEATGDVFIQRLKAHQKHLWKLTASVEEVENQQKLIASTTAVVVTVSESAGVEATAIKKAFDLGYAASKAGKGRAPAQNKELVDMLETGSLSNGKPFKGSFNDKIMTAYMRGHQKYNDEEADKVLAERAPSSMTQDEKEARAFQIGFNDARRGMNRAKAMYNVSMALTGRSKMIGDDPATTAIRKKCQDGFSSYIPTKKSD